jgi:hypothetical protein
MRSTATPRIEESDGDDDDDDDNSDSDDVVMKCVCSVSGLRLSI